MKTVEQRTRFYTPPKDKPTSDKWTLIRSVGRDILSPDAQLKLEWIIFYSTIAKRNAKHTATHFGISRKTFHKWLKRFNETNLKTLEAISRRPVNTREWMVTKVQERRIITLRKANMEYGKKKLKRIYEREYGDSISTWKIERVIRAFNLFPDKPKREYQVAKRAKSKPKVRIHEVKEAIAKVHKFGFLWHIDAIIIWWYGQRRIIFTAAEDQTKIAYARVYSTNTSKYAEDFLKRLMYLVQGQVDISHQDNGSEFMGAFEKACQTLGILQIYSRVRTPTDNAALENFNGTLQREWLERSEVGLDDIDAANQDLTLWLIKFNSYRPHEALDYQTPLEYAHEQFFKVLPMWPASTKVCVQTFLYYNCAMSKDRANYFRNNAVRALVGITVGLNAACGSVDKDLDNKPSNEASNILDQNGTLNSLPMESPQLEEELLKKVSTSLAMVTVNVTQGYKAHMKKEFRCSGFIVRNSKNVPVVVTAQHCVPEFITSEQDGIKYRTVSSEGNSIFEVQVSTLNGNKLNAESWGYIREQNPIDTIILNLPQDAETVAVNMHLNSGTLKKWDTYYIARLTENGVTVAPVRFHTDYNPNNRWFIDLSQEAPSCFPGVSGSMVVNSAGEIVSVLRGSAFYTLTSQDVDELNVDPIHTGRVVKSCVGVPASKILELLR